MPRALPFLALAATLAWPSLAAAQSSTYKVPPAPIPQILDAPPTPTAVLSPAGDRVVLLQPRAMPTIAEQAEPIRRLAGARFVAASGAPVGAPSYVAISIASLDGSAAKPVTLPLTGAERVLSIGYAPDGARYAFATVRGDRVELWLLDMTSGAAREVPGVRLNTSLGVRCEWTADSLALACLTVPSTRGDAPKAAAVPSGPNVQESRGTPAPVRTYQDLLGSAHDEALFVWATTSSISVVPVDGTAPAIVGAPGLYTLASPAPSGRFLLVEELQAPFSRLVPYDDFAKHVRVVDRSGTEVYSLAKLPLADAVPINGVPTGPRRYGWDPTQPARLTWMVALDDGNPKKTVPHRDRLMALTLPSRMAPVTWHRTEHRCASLSFTEDGDALVSEYDRPTRRTRLSLVRRDASVRVLSERSSEDAYSHPGTPYRLPGRDAILTHEGRIYMLGTGASPDGDRPFADALDLRTGTTTRLFRSSGEQLETVVGIASRDGRRLLTRHESRTSPPNYVLRTLPATTAGASVTGQRLAITAFPDPAPALKGMTKERLSYTRKDGVALSATLYLPPGYAAGTRPPLLMWAYPQEFTSAAAAGQINGSPYKFDAIRGASHLLLLTQGYAILDDPSMPIVSEGETANDHYVEQLVASAEAAVDAVVARGVADRDRIAIGGHSYGAFMTANLLAHSDLFRAGLARSGAYNRTLTPFGFQAETRTFWEIPEIYARMSPFWFAHTINEPILLTHGEADNNSGTFPIQSERFYMALKGNGATVRYVTLPHESHGYAARESVLHTVAEMLEWLDVHVKTAPARGSQIAPSAAAR
ncbi:MAG TPA: prolyl oligopeptidase family serine peptidase [Luteitalea sp.]|nr:prolyl oligopeptidase family serine peptidase [Luteitalea sp.]